MFNASGVTLKLHRTEVMLAVALAGSVAGAATLLSEPLLAVFEDYLWSVMSVLPFGVGLLVGVPVVSRELEARTAQVAWSLEGSRTRWLLRQSVPIALALVAAIALTAWTMTLLVSRPQAHPEAPFIQIGSYGLPVLGRALGGFGIGLLTGTLIGRALPSLVFGALLCLAISVVAFGARDSWLASQGPQLRIDGQTQVIQTGWGMLAPDGTELSLASARALVPAGAESDAWLEEHGYSWLPLGISMAAATRWAWYDAALFVVAGGIAAVGAAALVQRKRPT